MKRFVSLSVRMRLSEGEIVLCSHVFVGVNTFVCQRFGWQHLCIQIYFHSKVLRLALPVLYILMKMKHFENSKEKQPVEQNKRNKDDLSGLLEITLHCQQDKGDWEGCGYQIVCKFFLCRESKYLQIALLRGRYAEQKMTIVTTV